MLTLQLALLDNSEFYFLTFITFLKVNKNNIIGVVLMAAVLIGYSVYSQPSAEEKAAAARQDSIENVARKNAENAAKLAAQQKIAQAQAAAEAE